MKVGRDREFTQCDVDVVGIEGQMIEAELLNLYIRGYSKLGIDIIIKYNSRKLMSGLIKEAGVIESDVSSVITILDKINKISKDELTDYLFEIGLNKEITNLLLEYFTLDLNMLNNKFMNTSNEMLKAGLDEINNLEKFILSMNIEKYCEFGSSLARGQDYYTGNVFEVYEANGLIKSAIGGGGRYDSMIGDFINDGNVYPAVGVSFGLTCLYELLKNRRDFYENSLIDIYIIPINTCVDSLLLAEELRNLGFRVDIEMKNRKIKKSLDFANKENIPYIILLGEDELKNRKFTIKDMLNNNDLVISFDNLSDITKLKRNI